MFISELPSSSHHSLQREPGRWLSDPSHKQFKPAMPPKMKQEDSLRSVRLSDSSFVALLQCVNAWHSCVSPRRHLMTAKWSLVWRMLRSNNASKFASPSKRGTHVCSHTRSSARTWLTLSVHSFVYSLTGGHIRPSLVMIVS